MSDTSKPSNRVLLHILKNNPRNAEVYITWEGETFCGQMSKCEITRLVDEPAHFSISGYIKDQ